MNRFAELLDALPDQVTLDGELPVIRNGAVAPFNDLQLNDLRQRLNRKSPDAKMRRAYPAAVRLYDLLREGGDDLRDLPFVERRRRLETWFAGAARRGLDLSPLIPFADWEELRALRHTARDNAIEGIMLKRTDSLYVAGRPRGPWFKWKRRPLTIDAVLIYAQRGQGKRSSFYSDYTFGAWNGAALVPVGKADSGFTDEELRRLDKWVRDNTVNRYGPAREAATLATLEGLIAT